MKKETAKKKIKLKILLLLPLSIILLGLMLFLPAGSIGYWHAWAFMSVLFIPFIFVVIYLLIYDPELLERRLRFKEKESQQKIIIKLASLILLIGLIVAGLDFRYKWSDVPLFIVVLADILIFLGYLLVFMVFRENSYTSRIVEVEKDQKVISTGPYSIIRHPMYAGIMIMYLCMPIALGSYWALIFSVPVMCIIMFRALNEERVLLKNLKGYKEYCKKVKYRIIPYIW